MLADMRWVYRLHAKFSFIGAVLKHKCVQIGLGPNERATGLICDSVVIPQLSGPCVNHLLNLEFNHFLRIKLDCLRCNNGWHRDLTRHTDHWDNILEVDFKICIEVFLIGVVLHNGFYANFYGLQCIIYELLLGWLYVDRGAADRDPT